MRNSVLMCRCKHVAAFGFSFIFLAMIMSGCKSGQSISKSALPVVTENLDYLGSVANNTPVITNFSSKMKLTVNSNGKDISVNGTFRMKKNEVIQLSIVPFLGIEAGRVEFTPTKMLIIDRINKQYVEEPISELSAMANTDMDFYTLQALFTNALFLPGNKELNNKLLSQFTVHSSADNKTMEIKKKAKDFVYSFSANSKYGTAFGKLHFNAGSSLSAKLEICRIPAIWLKKLSVQNGYLFRRRKEAIFCRDRPFQTNREWRLGISHKCLGKI